MKMKVASIKRNLKEFREIKESQSTDYNCGAYALYYCYSLLGYRDCPDSIDKRLFSSTISKMWRYSLGTLPSQLLKVIEKDGVKSSELMCDDNNDRGFFNMLDEHLAQDGNAIMFVNCGHWISIVGKKGRSYIVRDPAYKKPYLKQLSRSELCRIGWNEMELEFGIGEPLSIGAGLFLKDWGRLGFAGRYAILLG